MESRWGARALTTLHCEHPVAVVWRFSGSPARTCGRSPTREAVPRRRVGSPGPHLLLRVLLRSKSWACIHACPPAPVALARVRAFARTRGNASQLWCRPWRCCVAFLEVRPALAAARPASQQVLGMHPCMPASASGAGPCAGVRQRARQCLAVTMPSVAVLCRFLEVRPAHPCAGVRQRARQCRAVTMPSVAVLCRFLEVRPAHPCAGVRQRARQCRAGALAHPINVLSIFAPPVHTPIAVPRLVRKKLSKVRATRLRHQPFTLCRSSRRFMKSA